MTTFISHTWLMKILLLTGLVIALAFAYKPLLFLYQRSQINDVSVIELKNLLTQKDHIVLIDVRTPAEYQVEHIDNAISMPVDTIEQQIDTIKKLTADKKLITYCETGPRSYQALITLKKYQIDGLNLKGGFEAWWQQTKFP